MPKKRLTQISEDYEVSFEEAITMVSEKLPEEHVSGKGKNTWIDEEGQEILSRSLMIDEITPKYYSEIVKSECPNPRFVFVYLRDIKKKVPVMIPRRLAGTLLGKKILIEAITDTKGTSYRYAKPKRHNPR